MSLYRTYRPHNFANLVGQDHVKTTLCNALREEAVAHAYLFCGPRGTGKTSTARLIAKALNCTARADDGEPCGECEMCVSLTEGKLIDVIEIDAASNRGIDEMRDLKEKIQFAPTRALNKIYIIDEVHMLTKEAFNALLKTLEEPPSAVYFILATTEVHKVPETIISRCQRFDFKRIDEKTLMTRLNFIAQKEGIEVDEAAVALIARYVQGGLRDAIGLLEQMTFHGKLDYDYVRTHLGVAGHQTVTALIEALSAGKLQAAINLINEVNAEGYDLESFVREILEMLRERLLGSLNEDISVTNSLLAMIEAFQDARSMMRASVIPQLPLEVAAIKICAFSGTQSTVEIPIKEAKGETETVAKIKESFEKEETQARKSSVKKTTSAPERTNADAEISGIPADVSATDDHAPFTISYLKEKWPSMIEKVKPPSLKRTLADAAIAQATENIVTLKFKSEFHFAAVEKAENKASIEKVLSETFGTIIKLECELEAVSLMPKDEPNADPKSIARHAMEIFGGEME